jgi:deoxyribonuclease V
MVATVSVAPVRHRWPTSIRGAIRLQERLRDRLRLTGGPRRVAVVAGADISYDLLTGRLHAAVLNYSFPSLQRLETALIRAPICFPYVPGLLSFREAPALVQAFGRLSIRPDLLICDGQGIAHPRGIGLASHLGLLLDLPTIGCAKSRLIGTHRAPAERRGAIAPLYHGRRRIGTVVRSRRGVRPLYVSPGHRIGIDAAARYVLACCIGYRLPEPLRQADLTVGAARRGLPLRTSGCGARRPPSL